MEMSPLQNKLLQRSAHIRVSLPPPSPGGAVLTVRLGGCGVGARTGKVSQGIAVWKGRGRPRGWNILSARTSPGKLTGLERRFLPPESQRGNTFVFVTHLHFSGDQVIVWHWKAARGKFHLPPPDTEKYRQLCSTPGSCCLKCCRWSSIPMARGFVLCSNTNNFAKACLRHRLIFIKSTNIY